MAKFLFATVPIHGHVSPGLPIAHTLVEQGHEVLWYCTKKYREKIRQPALIFPMSNQPRIMTTAV